jgi:carboxymethylenebutenolidase
MNVEVGIHKQSILIAAAALAAALAPLAISQQVTTATSPEEQRSKQQDGIIRADIPYAKDGWRAENLAQSPRKHEMVKVGAREAFVVYPLAEKAPVIVMMPEDQGLNNWSREMADTIAAMGAVVIVPDWLSGRGPNGGGHDSFPDVKSVLMANYDVTQEMTTADQNAWADWGEKLPQYNGKLAVIGFGWGAGKAWAFAADRKDLAAAFIFYDWVPPGLDLSKLSADVYGFYASKDTRVERSIPTTKAAMEKLGRKYEYVDYKDADHMFVRLAEMAADKNPANLYARNDSLARLQKLIEGLK